MRIVVFGDSISEGLFDYKKGGWTNRLKIYLWKKYSYDSLLMNYAVSAYTTTHVLNCFSACFNAVSRRQKGKEKDSILIIMIGINDAAKDIHSGEYQVSPEKFQENLEKISEKIEKEKLIKEVIFISNINIWEEKTNASALEFYDYNEDIQKYNARIQTFCEEKNYHFLDIFGIMKHSDLQIDGTHPNASGHKKIYKKVKNYLEKNILSSQK